MPKWLKVTLILLGAAVLVLGLLVAGAVSWFGANKERLIQAGKAAEAEGTAYGAAHAESACVDDALSHLKSCGQVDVVCEASTKLRLMSCMSVAQDDGTCNMLPESTEIMKGARWGADECARRGQPGSQACGRLIRGVIEACAKIQKKPE
jgi:hypothetical protein